MDPITSYGILMPVLQHRWRVAFNTRKYEVGLQTNILTRQATKVDINYVKKEAVVYIEQSVLGEEHQEILDLCSKGYFFFRVDAMDGNESIHHSLMMNNASVTDHNIKFDYSKSAVLCHELKIKFSTISLWEPQKPEVTSYDKAKEAIK